MSAAGRRTSSCLRLRLQSTPLFDTASAVPSTVCSRTDVCLVVAGAPAQRYGAERLLEMAAGGRAVQQAALASPEALKALLERALSGLLQARPPMYPRAHRHTI